MSKHFFEKGMSVQFVPREHSPTVPEEIDRLVAAYGHEKLTIVGVENHGHNPITKHHQTIVLAKDGEIVQLATGAVCEWSGAWFEPTM
ncbi:MAG: hypothetical protein AAB734_02750 [Patescibacteria group bacterium]